MEKCPRFPGCSANLCPLDPETAKRTYLPGEDVCPFTIKKRSKDQKGIRILATDSLLEAIPELNIKMLSGRNQKHWHALHQGC
jgi:hypothetical protein